MTRPSDSAGLPAELRRRAEAFLSGDGGGWPVPPLRDAATVILLRDGSTGPEVFLQRRVGTMKFAAGMYVFPGGKVEASDADGRLISNPGTAGEPFEQPQDADVTADFAAIVTAGARETWEEARVLLAVDQDGQSLLPPAEPPSAILEWLARNGAKIDTESLKPWAHWLTPEIERRRYDTRFVITRIPDGQVGQDLGQESEESIWVTPAAALSKVQAGEMAMLPPTFDTLNQLADFHQVDNALKVAEGRAPTPLLPRPQRGSDGAIGWVLVNGYTGDVLRKW